MTAPPARRDARALQVLDAKLADIHHAAHTGHLQLARIETSRVWSILSVMEAARRRRGARPRRPA